MESITRIQLYLFLKILSILGRKNKKQEPQLRSKQPAVTNQMIELQCPLKFRRIQAL